MFGADTDRELAKLHRIELDDDSANEISPVDCLRCGTAVPRHKPVCRECGQAMTPAAAQELQAARAEADTAKHDAIDADAAALAETVADVIRDDLDLAAELLED